MKHMRELIQSGGIDRLKEFTETTRPLAAERKKLDGIGKSLSTGAALKHFQMRACSNIACGKREDKGATLLSCAQCVKAKAVEAALYCCRDCQVAHWPSHKITCGKASTPPPEFDGTWVDKWRGCSDGAYHYGTLELITWPGTDGERDAVLGFGGVYLEEADELKGLFEGKYKGSLSKFCKVRPKQHRTHFLVHNHNP